MFRERTPGPGLLGRACRTGVMGPENGGEAAMRMAAPDGLTGAISAVSRFRASSFRGSAAFFALLLAAASGSQGDEAIDAGGAAWLASSNVSNGAAGGIAKAAVDGAAMPGEAQGQAQGQARPGVSKFSRRRFSPGHDPARR